MAFDYRELNRLEEAAFNRALKRWVNSPFIWLERLNPDSKEVGISPVRYGSFENELPSE